MADIANDPRIDPRIKAVLSAIPAMQAAADVESRDVLLARASTPEAIAQRAMLTQIFDAADNEDIAPSKGLSVTEHAVETETRSGVGRARTSLACGHAAHLNKNLFDAAGCPHLS